MRWAACCRKTLSAPNILHTSMVTLYEREEIQLSTSTRHGSFLMTHQLLCREYRVHDRDVRRGLVRRDRQHEDPRVNGSRRALPSRRGPRGVRRRPVDVCVPPKPHAFRAAFAGEKRAGDGNSQHSALVRQSTSPMGAARAEMSPVQAPGRERSRAHPLPPRLRVRPIAPLSSP